MKLRALRVHDLRDAFQARGVAIEDIGDGLSCLIQNNEFGKSTLLAALETLLTIKYGSTKEEVASLRPPAGGGPTISADLAFPDGTFRVEKRYLMRATARVTSLPDGRLVAQKDLAEAWLAARLGGPAQDSALPLLWVRQGQATDFSKGLGARSRALADVVAETAAELTGEGDLARLQAEVGEKLGRLVTGKSRRWGAPKAGGRLADALKARDDLARRRDEARRDRDRLEEDFAAVATARAELAGWADPEAAAAEAAALDEAREALQAARLAAEKLTAAQTGASFAALRRERADAALGIADAAAAECAAAGSAFAEAADNLERRRRAAIEAREAADRARAAAREASLALEADLKREAAGRARLRASEARAQRGELERRRADAEAARREGSEAQARADAIAITRADVAQVEALRDSLRTAEARRDAGRVSVAMAYLDPSARAVSLDGAALADGESRSLEGPATLDIAGVGRLTVTPGLGVDAGGRDVAKAALALREALDRHGVSDAAALRAALDEKAAHARAAQEQARLVAIHAPEGLPALLAALAALPPDAEQPDDAAEPEAPANLDELADAAAAARGVETAARAREKAATQAEAEAAQALAAAEADMRSAQERRDRAEAATGPAPTRDARRAALADAVAEAARAEREAVEALGALLAAPAPSVAEAEAQVRRLERARHDRTAAVARLRAEIDARAEAIVRAGGAETRLAALEDELAAAEAEAARWTLRAEALKRLDRALADAESGLRDRRHAPLHNELAPLLTHVFGPGAELALDDGLAPAALRRRGAETAQRALSGGAQEQVAILTRLAWAAVLARGGAAPPVIFDDTLAQTDDKRLDRMFQVIGTMAERLQIIVLSCHRRAFARLGGAQLTLADWRPDEW